MPIGVPLPSGSVDTVRLLLQRGADVNRRSDTGNTALIRSVYAGHVAVVRLLLGADADIHVTNNRGQSSFFLASILRRTQIVDLLLDAGVDAESAAADLDTALIACEGKGQKKILELLLARATHATARKKKK